MNSPSLHTPETKSVLAALEDVHLLERERNLAGLLRSVKHVAQRLLNLSAAEGGLHFDSLTGATTGVYGRISLGEPVPADREKGIHSIDSMFAKLNRALAEHQLTVWVLLDRLDVAFADSHELEANAMRALLRAYNDLRLYAQLSLKIFLREDIWRRVTEKGFREASHITRVEVMRWTSPMLLNLCMRRILSNATITAAYGVNREEILRDAEKQQALYDRIFPEQVEQGSRKSRSFDWMVTRCADGTGNTAPRELIHLLNCLRDEEIRRLERGESPAPDGQLFDRKVFKAALPAVSETRLHTYLYAEYPHVRTYVELLKEQKTEQTAESLASIWSVERHRATELAQELVKLGFMEEKSSGSGTSYWVPFLYRDALRMVQGRATVGR